MSYQQMSEMKRRGKFNVKTVLNILTVSIAFVVLFSIYLLISLNTTRRYIIEEDNQDLSSETGETKPSYRSVNFSRYSQHQFILSEREPMSLYIGNSWSKTSCLNTGTKYTLYKECKCRDGWHGQSCSLPDSLYFSYKRHSMTRKERRRLRLRKKTARRIVYAVLFNHEFDMLEALLHEHEDLVDVFIVMESSYTAFGSPKPLRLLPRLHRGYLKRFHWKILYLFCDNFPTGGRKKGWKADSYFRSLLGKSGLNNIHNIHDDDIFIVLDIDEIPSHDSLAFLKFHDGYPEPFGVRMRYSVFGYFWKNTQFTQVTMGCTIGMLKTVFSNDSNAIRDIEHGLNSTIHPSIREYSQKHNVRAWFLGDNSYYAGWHCSGCFKLEGIRTKFISAQNADYPRWGSIQEKMDLEYLRMLVKEGKWFDGGQVPSSELQKDDFFAPSHFIRNQDKYKHLLFNPFQKTNEVK